MTKLTEISGDEFVKKMLSGERDFGGIRLINFNLSTHESVDTLQTYLDGQDLEVSPLILSNSYLIGLVASNMSLPYLMATKSNFGGGNFAGTYLRGTNFGGSLCRGTNFERADLEEVSLSEVDMEHASVGDANFKRAFLKGVINLEKTEGLAYAIFEDTIVTPQEKKIIQDALGITDLFDVREN